MFKYKIGDIVEPRDVLVFEGIHGVLVLNHHTVIPVELEYEVAYTLQDILNKLDINNCYTIALESPLRGEIYRYNNYGEHETIMIGETMGYA